MSFSKKGQGRIVIGLLLLAMWGRGVSGAQDKQTLGTKVTATGNVIVLDWDKKHPWDIDLSSRGATLMAEYMTESRGVVVERASSARPVGVGTHAIHFRLPDALIAIPKGPVCLYIEVGGQRILPIRRADARGDETTRFRDRSWERSVVSRTGATTHERKLAELQTAMSSAQSATEAQQATLTQKGWSSTASCDSIPTPAFTAAQKPADVLPLKEHADAARRVCISRVVWGQKVAAEQVELKNADFALRLVQPPDVDAALLQYLRSQPGSSRENLQQREAQLTRMRTDWTRWSRSANDYDPPFGEKGDHLVVQDVDHAVAATIMTVSPNGRLELTRETHPDSRLVAGYLGASLEAYTRCVVDGQKQLEAKQEAWTEMQARAPQLAAMAHQQLIASCKTSFDHLAALKAQQNQLAVQYAAEQAQTITGDAAEAPPAASQVLNSVACSARDH